MLVTDLGQQPVDLLEVLPPSAPTGMGLMDISSGNFFPW
jgi:hypothetical protein